MVTALLTGGWDRAVTTSSHPHHAVEEGIIPRHQLTPFVFPSSGTLTPNHLKHTEVNIKMSTSKHTQALNIQICVFLNKFRKAISTTVIVRARLQ